MENTMNHETAGPYDILVSDCTPSGKLTNIGTAWPTPKGAGCRPAHRITRPEGAQLLVLADRRRAAPSQPVDQTQG